MKNSDLHTPILVTGVPRSGSTFIARILKMAGGMTGKTDRMYENTYLTEINTRILLKTKKSLILPETAKLPIISNFKGNILNGVRKSQESYLKWLYKSHTLTQLWPIWAKAFPEAQWIIVRRKPNDIINSCMKTGYMTLMSNPENLKLIGVKTEEEGWKWLIHQYENRWKEMIKAGLNVKEVWPDRMENEDFSQIKELIKWVGLEWNEKIRETMIPIFTKTKGNK